MVSPASNATKKLGCIALTDSALVKVREIYYSSGSPLSQFSTPLDLSTRLGIPPSLKYMKPLQFSKKQNKHRDKTLR